MWQRVQTLYLMIASALVAALFFSVKAFVFGPDGTHAQEFRYIDYTPYLILLIVVALLQVIALTTFKVRVLQMRTAVLSALILVALQGWLAVDFFTADKSVVFRWTAVFPLVAALLDVWAARAIFRDQLLVESLSSLRKRRR
ncbi:MAG: DUF4293 family protein [Bacteroidales bacterium]|nr:DUF4293 family protein [Bacteroidales bacterium]MBR1636977.1 DUF4293 family protein [Bacteroidales bacterium]MBR1894854.1 DUF4293 family protein [Bacteroidales bacterium]